MDAISDMLIRIKNAQAVRHENVLIPFSGLKHQIALLLKNVGYIEDVEKKKRKARTAEVDWLELKLKYVPTGAADGGQQGAISGIRLVSRPSRHLYVKARSIKPVRSGFGMSIVSTPKGIMTGTQARRENVGGEILFEVW